MLTYVRPLIEVRSGPGWKSAHLRLISETASNVPAGVELERVRNIGLRSESAVTLVGTPRRDERAPGGIEFDARKVAVLNQSAENFPFTSVSRLEQLSPDLVVNYRPLTLRTDRGARRFRVEAALVAAFRAALRKGRFTEFFTSKIVASATEGGTSCQGRRAWYRRIHIMHVAEAGT